MQSCNSKCGHCARNFWKWLKSREHQMSMPLGSGTSFAQEAARSNVPGRPLTPGTRVLYNNQKAVVLADSGFFGLDGRHWVKVFVETQAWTVHVERGDLLVACSVASPASTSAPSGHASSRGFE